MITKIQAAERQLDTAIRLFFENIDHLSSYTLAAASRAITDDLCEKKKHELFQQEFERLGDALEVRLSFREAMKIIVKPQYHKDAVILFHKRQNFLKHADRDHDGVMDDLNPRELALVIMFAGRNFTLLEQRLTPTLSIFLHWFGAAEPTLLNKPNNPSEDNFLKIVHELRRNIQDLYSPEAFQLVHMALQTHCQPARRLLFDL